MREREVCVSEGEREIERAETEIDRQTAVERKSDKSERDHVEYYNYT